MCGYSARLLHPANVGSTMKYLAEFYSAKDQRGVRDQETCDVICGQPLPIAGREEKFRNVFWWSGLFFVDCAIYPDRSTGGISGIVFTPLSSQVV